MKKEQESPKDLNDEIKIAKIILNGLKEKKLMTLKIDRSQDNIYSYSINSKCLGSITRPNLSFLVHFVHEQRELIEPEKYDLTKCKSYEISFL